MVFRPYPFGSHIKPNKADVRGSIGKNPDPKLKQDKAWKKFTKCGTPHLTRIFCKNEL